MALEGVWALEKVMVPVPRGGGRFLGADGGIPNTALAIRAGRGLRHGNLALSAIGTWPYMP